MLDIHVAYQHPSKTRDICAGDKWISSKLTLLVGKQFGNGGCHEGQRERYDSNEPGLQVRELKFWGRLIYDLTLWGNDLLRGLGGF